MSELYSGSTAEFVDRTMQNRIARDLMMSRDVSDLFRGYLGA